MRFTTMLLTVCLPFVASGQGPRLYDGVMAEGRPTARQMTAAEFRLVTVEHILNSRSPLKIGAVQLHRMGDELAVHLVKLSAKSGKLTPTQASTALDMIEVAFERPASILAAVDRTPNTTVSLLRDLAGSPDHSQATRSRIGALLRRFVSSR